jgi:hypothetical protein
MNTKKRCRVRPASEIRCQAPKFLGLIFTMLFSSLLTAQTTVPSGNSMGSNPTVRPMISNKHSAKEVNPVTYAAEVTNECAIKAIGSEGHAEVCREGVKKYCPKGYELKQRPHVCPKGKICAAVMDDFCEKQAAK